MKTKITPTNLTRFIGHPVFISCAVGICCQLRGTLSNGYLFCAYSVELKDGSKVGFSYGEYEVRDLQVHVSIQ